MAICLLSPVRSVLVDEDFDLSCESPRENDLSAMLTKKIKIK